MVCGLPAQHRVNFSTGIKAFPPSPGDQTLSAAASHEPSDPRVSIPPWSSSRSCCSREVLLLGARPKAGHIVSGDLAPLQLRFLPAALPRSLPRPPMSILFPDSAPLGGIFAGRAELGMLPRCGNPRGIPVVPRCPLGTAPSAFPAEIPVDKGLDEAHVRDTVCR